MPNYSRNPAPTVELITDLKAMQREFKQSVDSLKACYEQALYQRAIFCNDTLSPVVCNQLQALSAQADGYFVALNTQMSIAMAVARFLEISEYFDDERERRAILEAAHILATKADRQKPERN